MSNDNEDNNIPTKNSTVPFNSDYGKGTFVNRLSAAIAKSDAGHKQFVNANKMDLSFISPTFRANERAKSEQRKKEKE